MTQPRSSVSVARLWVSRRPRVTAAAAMLTFAVMAATVMSNLTHAAISPADQRSAERLTLHPSDVGPGWTITRKASTSPRLNSCPSAPVKVELAMTGFSDSASFETNNKGNDANSTTRVFSSDALSHALVQMGHRA